MQEQGLRDLSGKETLPEIGCVLTYTPCYCRIDTLITCHLVDVRLPEEHSQGIRQDVSQSFLSVYLHEEDRGHPSETC